MGAKAPATAISIRTVGAVAALEFSEMLRREGAGWARRGQWGEGLTGAEMEKCRWLKPRLVATIDYLERTAANQLRHAMFARLSTPKRQLSQL